MSHASRQQSWQHARASSSSSRATINAAMCADRLQLWMQNAAFWQLGIQVTSTATRTQVKRARYRAAVMTHARVCVHVALGARSVWAWQTVG
jgi:hypothetical protein